MEIAARVASLQNTAPGAKAGVMIRETPRSALRHAMVVVTSVRLMRHSLEQPLARKEYGHTGVAGCKVVYLLPRGTGHWDGLDARSPRGRGVDRGRFDWDR